MELDLTRHQQAHTADHFQCFRSRTALPRGIATVETPWQPLSQQMRGGHLRRRAAQPYGPGRPQYLPRRKSNAGGIEC